MDLQIKNLSVAVAESPIIAGLSLTMRPGEIHAIMGPNGSGKSTLANALMGHPKYTLTGGKIMVGKTDVSKLSPDKRFKAGLFLSMQYPPEIPGVNIANFLRLAVSAKTGKNVGPIEFNKILASKMADLKMNPDFARRGLNSGFSGGEKKKAEILQLLLLDPAFAILDETDSGLDVDALRTVATGINTFHTKKNGVLLITHYNRILEYIVPDYVHIMVAGKIVASGGKDLAKKIEKTGYKDFV